MKRAQYQSGHVVRVERAPGAIWRLRFRKDGQQRSVYVGTVAQYPTLEEAEAAAWPLREQPNQQGECTLFGHLIDRFEKAEMPSRESTASAYRSHLTRIRGRWAKEALMTW